MAKSSFVFYETFYEQIKELPDELKGVFFMYITEYGLYDKEPEITDGVQRAVWIPIREAIDRAKARRRRNAENGAKGGRPKSEENPPKANETEKKQKRFTPPTLEEVKAEITAKGYRVDAQRFINFYESNGWRVGKNKMVSWRSTLAGWNAREKENGKPATIFSKENDTSDYEEFFK